MTRRSVACAAVIVLLASGCASQHEEASRQEPAPASERERDYEAAPEEVESAPAPSVAAEEPDDESLSLADIQRELAANNAKLRALGVELPEGRPAEAPAGGAKSTSKSTSKASKKSTSSSSSKSSGDAGGGASTTPPAPGGRPSVEPSKPKAEEHKPKRDKSSDKSSGKRSIGDEVGSPDPAKAAPRSPQAGLDAAARCEQVCDLAAISCGLGDQICELADRHPDEPDYASACERANLDCEVAKEACDACVE